MDSLPAFITRPPAVLAELPTYAGSVPPVTASPSPAGSGSFAWSGSSAGGVVPGETTLRQGLDSGIPTRLPLSGTRALVLAVGLGKAREVMTADPAAVVIDLAADPGDLARDPDQPVARLTLLDGALIGDTAPVVVGTRLALAAGGHVAVEVVVDALTITAGTLRSPGRYGGSITLRWRPVGTAPDDGPPPAPGDPSLPRFTVWRASGTSHNEPRRRGMR